MNRISSVCLAALLVLAACQTPGEKNLARMLDAEAGGVPPVWLDALPETANTGDWAKAFSDPLLAGYLQRGAEQNFDIRIAKMRLARAEAARRAARAGLGPSFGLSGRSSSTSPLEDSDFQDSFGLDATVRLDLSPFGPARANAAAAKASLRAEEARAQAVYQNVNRAIAKAYYTLAEADQLLLLAESNLTFQSQILALVKARFAAGADAKDTLMQSEADYNSALAAIELQRAQRRDAERALQLLLGDYPEGAPKASPAETLPFILPERGIPASALSARPDVAEAQALMAVAEARLWQARRARLPGLALSGTIGGSQSDLSDLFDPSAYIAALGASVLTTLFDSGGLEASRDQAKAVADEALLVYARALRQAVSEIDSAYDRARASHSASEYQKAAAIAGREALRLARIKYEAGDTELIDLLALQRQSNALEASLIRARTDQAEAMIDAYAAIGGALMSSP